MKINECVDLIYILPDTLIEQKGVILSWNNKTNFDKCINTIRLQYRAIAYWLKYYLCDYDYPELRFELTHTLKANYKPLADCSKAFYNLIQETSLHSSFLEDYNLNAAKLLYFIEREICTNVLKNTGIIHKPIIRGKEEVYKSTKLICDNLEDPNKHKFFEYGQIKTHIDFLINEALEITKIPINWEFREHFRKFLKTIKRCENKFRGSSSTQNAYLVNGELILLDGHGKRKK